MLKLMGKKICTSLKVLFILTYVLYSFFRLGTLCHFLIVTLVNVYVDLVVFTRIAGTLKTGNGRYWR